MNGGARRGSKKSSKGSKGKKSQRGGGVEELTACYNAGGTDAVIKACLAGKGTPADAVKAMETASAEVKAAVKTALSSYASKGRVALGTECYDKKDLAACAAMQSGGKRRGSKKGSKGKKSMRGGATLAEMKACFEKGGDNAAVQACVAGKTSAPPPAEAEAIKQATTYLQRADTLVQASVKCLNSQQRDIPACTVQKILTGQIGGKRRGSKKASKKGSKKGGAKKGSKKASKKGSKKGKKY